MKECYFCHSEIPEDSVICPMCGSDLTDVESMNKTDFSNPSVLEPATSKQQSKTRRKKSSFNLKTVLNSALNYLLFNIKRCVHPLREGTVSERNSFYGYINIIVASIISSVILARTLSAFEKSYQLLSQISILPSLTFQFNLFEWVWKLSVFFIVYFLLLPIILFLFKKITSKQSLAFHSGVTQFAGMSSLLYFILIIGLMINFIAPLGMALPVILIIFLHCLSYQVAFVSSVHLNFNKQETSMSKLFQLSLLGMIIHSVFLFIIAYILIKL